MKRFFVLAMCILVLCSGSIISSAEEVGTYENAGELYAAWTSQNCVPDYITGVWSSDGGYKNLTFGVLKGEAGDLGKQEILALVRDDSTVSIVHQTYSRNYLYRIQEEVVDAYFEEGLGLVTAGVMEKENKLRFEVHTDFTDNVDTQAMIQHVTEQYGDAVYFSYIDTYPQFVGGTQPAPTGPILVMTNPQNHVFPFAFVLCGIVLAFLIFIEIQRRRVMAVAVDGTPMIIDEKPISKKDVEAAIRETDIKPSETLDDRVIRSIQLDS